MLLFQMLERQGKNQAIEHSLFLLFEKPLLKYYGSDAGTKRVKDFLSWLKRNDSTLTKQFYSDIKSGWLDLSQMEKSDERTMAFIAGIWLGGRYMVPKMDVKAINYPQVVYEPDMKSLYTSYLDDRVVIELGGREVDWITAQCSSSTVAFLAGINCGIHEYTHAVPYMVGMPNENKLISELGVAYVQGAFALPIKFSDNLMGFATVRNAYKDIKDAVALLDEEKASYIMHDYLTQSTLPWLRKRMEKNFDLCSFARTHPPRLQVKLMNLFNGDYSKSDFAQDCALQDKKLLNELLNTLDKISSLSAGKSAMEALEIFSREMTNQFGAPVWYDYPYNYGLLDMGEKSFGSFELAGLLPVKKDIN